MHLQSYRDINTNIHTHRHINTDTYTKTLSHTLNKEYAVHTSHLQSTAFTITHKHMHRHTLCIYNTVGERESIPSELQNHRVMGGTVNQWVISYCVLEKGNY